MERSNHSPRNWEFNVLKTQNVFFWLFSGGFNSFSFQPAQIWAHHWAQPPPLSSSCSQVLQMSRRRILRGAGSFPKEFPNLLLFHGSYSLWPYYLKGFMRNLGLLFSQQHLLKTNLVSIALSPLCSGWWLHIPIFT